MYDPQTGTTTVLNSASTLIWPTGIVVTRDRDVVFADFNGLTLTRVDVLGNSAAAGLVTNTPNRIAQDHNGEFIVAGYATGSWGGTPGGSPSSILRVDAAGAWTYVATLIGNPFTVIVEPTGTFGFGDYVLTLPLQGELQRIDNAGTVTTIASGLSTPTGVANFPNGDYAVVLSSTDSIVRIPRNGGVPTTWVPAGVLGNIKDILPDGEGGFYVTEAGGMLGSRLMHVDPTGAATLVLGNSTFGILQCAAIAPHLTGPPNPGTGATQGLFGLAVSFPQHANTPYTTVISESIFPGITFGGGDPRGTPLNPTPLFLQSLGVGVPPFTTNWVGTLDGSGNAAILMDLTPLPVGAFAGSRVYIQVGVLDFMAPTGISKMSNVVTLAFN